MLNIGFLEVGIVLIVALLVVGPERLPRLARRAGHWLVKYQKFWRHIQKEAEQTLESSSKNKAKKAKDLTDENRDD